MHFSNLFLLLLGASFCSESSDGSQSEEQENHGIVPAPVEEIQTPSEWTDFLTHMTGDDGDKDALVFLFDNHIVRPSAAILDIIRSEKCYNGLFDCTGLVDTCNSHGGYLTHRASIEDVECFFKFWVSHRDRGIRPCACMEGGRTIYYVMNLSCQLNDGANDLIDLDLFKLAQKYETREATEDDMAEYFAIHPWLRSPLRHQVLAIFLKPTCLCFLACYSSP